jgi:hypothetical protein
MQLISSTDSIIHSPQGRPCCHHHQGQICRKEGKFSPPTIARAEHSRFEIQGWERRDGFADNFRKAALMEKIAGRDHSTPRHRQQEPPIPSRIGRRYRALPIANHSPHVKGPPGKAQQGQTVHQGHQLQPPDAHTLHLGVGGIEGSRYRRYFQGSFPARGCEEDRQEGFGGEIHVWKEQMVLHSSQ